jgi:cyclopropane fatty-acyl-phospholipid synthase-like methyltransferase
MNGKVLENRYTLIKEYVKDKKVLDLGCVEHDAQTEVKNFWLHKFIKKYAKHLIGVDLEKKEIKKLNKKGYNIIYGNVENFDLNKKFDVVVAGELIEHLTNVGLFLDTCKKHMTYNSYLIITTPNASAIRYFLRTLFLGKNNENKFNHTYWFDYQTLIQNFDYADLEVVEWYYFYDSKKPIYKYLIEKFFVSIRSSFAPNILFVLRKKIK